MCVFERVSQKIQLELSGHDATLEDLRKKNRDKDPSQKMMGQMDLTQVHTVTTGGTLSGLTDMQNILYLLDYWLNHLNQYALTSTQIKSK